MLHTCAQGIDFPGPFRGQPNGLSGFISGDLHRWMKPTAERLETPYQPFEAGHIQCQRENDRRIWRAVGHGQRDVTFYAIVLQPDYASCLSLSPCRDGDQPKGLPK
jgi:hypothetical protein